jgi:hypothetical protein
VRFLENDKMKDIKEAAKRKFLKSKGLSDKDIEEAYEKYN